VFPDHRCPAGLGICCLLERVLLAGRCRRVAACEDETLRLVVAEIGQIVPRSQIDPLTGLGLCLAFDFGTPLAGSRLGGGLLPCELPPLTPLVT
jgi:hypothetical protein